VRSFYHERRQLGRVREVMKRGGSIPWWWKLDKEGITCAAGRANCYQNDLAGKAILIDPPEGLLELYSLIDDLPLWIA